MRLKEEYRFHLYISEPPCGDSSMLFQSEEKLHWTGAKSVDGGLSSVESGISRLKCGRSDIKLDQRSESMSCSDKILKWNLVGIQGGLISAVNDRPIFLSSIVIETPGYHDLRN